MKNLKRLLKFGKPKPGPITINKAYYLTVLAGRAQMPTLVSVLNPKGEGGAVVGLGAPLAAGTSKTDLAKPLERGAYALSSTDQLTVLKMFVMPKQEAGFDPQGFVQSPAAKSMDPEILHRIGATWMLVQLTFESYDPAGYPALDFFISVAKRLAELTDGVIADPVSQTYRLPESLVATKPEGVRVLAPEHIDVKVRPLEGGLHMYTLGLSKFDHPEIEMYGLSPTVQSGAARFLYGLAQAVLQGSKVELGLEVGEEGNKLKVTHGGLEESVWAKATCFELIPSGNRKIDEAIIAWVASVD